STSRKGRGGVGERERAAVVEDSRTGLDSAGLHNVEAPVTTDGALDQSGRGGRGVERAQVLTADQGTGEVRADRHETVLQRNIVGGQLHTTGNDGLVHVFGGHGVIGGDVVHGGGQSALRAARDRLDLGTQDLLAEVDDGEGQRLIADLGGVVQVLQRHVDADLIQLVIGDLVTGLGLGACGGQRGN